jgi:hypothetical protein
MSGRTLIYVGLAIVLLGALWLAAEKLGFGRMPGDIVVRKKNFTLYVPIVSSLVISLVLTLLFNVFRR